MSPLLVLIVTIGLIVLSAFFVIIEFALLGARRHRLEEEAVTSRSARATLKGMNELTMMLAVAQLGITACTFALGAVTKPGVEALLAPLFDGWMPDWLSGGIADEVWDKAEAALEEALNREGVDWELLPGEGAFYGPKIEFSLKDCIGRVWQCGTIQVDFSMPGRLGAQYVADNSERRTPVMLHRAVLGSFERFIGILIEEYEGAFPTWLAPTQVAILNITDNQREYCQNLAKKWDSLGYRVNADLRNEKIGFKIREHTLNKVPYLVVVGDKEVENNAVAIRTRKGEDLGTLSLDAFEQLLAEDIQRKGRTKTEI